MPVLSILAITLFAAAAASDLSRRRIPNALVLALLGLALARIAPALGQGAGAASAGADLAAAVAVFALGAVLFNFRLLGGGDVKLLAAGTLWLGAAQCGSFLALTALAGGLLALAYLIVRQFAARFSAHMLPGLPYGVAIAAAGVIATAAPG